MRVIVITGSQGRLGRLLFDRLHGDDLLTVGIERPLRSEAERGESDRRFFADLADIPSTERCLDRIVATHGGIQAVIHAAGGWATTPLVDGSPDAWYALLQSNLISTYVCFREAIRRMPTGGVLIAFASAQGADRGVAGQSAYSAAKAGVLRIVESTAAEFAEAGIRTHALAPSTIRYDEGDTGGGVRADDLVELCRMLLGPLGRPLSGQLLKAYGV